jgi:hypothetical protein
MPGYFKGFRQLNTAMVKNGVSRCRFFSLTARTTPGIGRFTLAIFGMSAKTALETRTPFHICQNFQAAFLIMERLSKLSDIKMFKK